MKYVSVKLKVNEVIMPYIRFIASEGGDGQPMRVFPKDTKLSAEARAGPREAESAFSSAWNTDKRQDAI